MQPFSEGDFFLLCIVLLTDGSTQILILMINSLKIGQQILAEHDHHALLHVTVFVEVISLMKLEVLVGVYAHLTAYILSGVFI